MFFSAFYLLFKNKFELFITYYTSKIMTLIYEAIIHRKERNKAYSYILNKLNYNSMMWKYV